ncbi:MAG: hypothetical protein L0170_12730 [Acidobacteria bacterium]|nr:hypothetical protein [Acidobacteriota bacterium]
MKLNQIRYELMQPHLGRYQLTEDEFHRRLLRFGIEEGRWDRLHHGYHALRLSDVIAVWHVLGIELEQSIPPPPDPDHPERAPEHRLPHTSWLRRVWTVERAPCATREIVFDSLVKARKRVVRKIMRDFESLLEQKPFLSGMVVRDAVPATWAEYMEEVSGSRSP